MIKSANISIAGSFIYSCFKYDASGNRVSKTTIDINRFVTTFYVRGAQGNVLTTYDYRYHQPIKISGQLICGSSRIGLWDRLRQEISHPKTGEDF